jgi:hypothetical protein
LIRPGEAWGEPGALPEGAVVVGSDAEARAALEGARRERQPFPPLGLVGGDLCRTLGGRGGLTTIVRCDLGEALVDGKVRLFVAHVVVRGRTLWRGAVTAVLNAQYVGGFDVAPRAHPGDGSLDIVELDAAVGLGERWKAWRRLPSGTHVPHPRINMRRASAIQLDVAGRRVVIDGEVQPPAKVLSIRVDPGAIVVAV